MADISENTMCTTNELAVVLGVSQRRVQQLKQQGAVVQESKNAYNLCTAVQTYIKMLQNNTKEKDDFKEEGFKLLKTKREKAELDLALQKGDAHRSDDVENVMSGMLIAFRSRLLSIPGKAAAELSAETAIPSIQKILKQEIYEALGEIKEYDPASFQNRGSPDASNSNED